jgi:hypothetical protein
MSASAFLIGAATEQARNPGRAGQTPRTRNEIVGLIVEPAHRDRHRLRWSAWRRRHLHRAQARHYRRQARNL